MPRSLRDEFLIPESVRDQLLELGIPRAKHTFDGLASLFPREFNVRALNMTGEDLARVLVHLTSRRIIPLTETSGPICLKQVKPGWHACRFYRDQRQLLELIAPYIAEGLHNGEACLWVLQDAISTQAACDAVAGHVRDIEGYLASGQLEILPHTEWYLDADGRIKVFEEIAAALIGRQDRALAKGFKFLRAAGDVGWISGADASKAFIDYENKVNAAIGATQVAAVCTYCADVTADELIAVITAHQDALELSA
jgi:hypothetical protein